MKNSWASWYCDSSRRNIQTTQRIVCLLLFSPCLLGGIRSRHGAGIWLKQVPKYEVPPYYKSASCPIRLQDRGEVIWGSRHLSTKYQQNGRA